MFGTHKTTYYCNAGIALQSFKLYQEAVFKATGDLIVITKVSLDSDRNTIIRYRIVKPKNGPAKELSEARKHLNNARIILDANNL